MTGFLFALLPVTTTKRMPLVAVNIIYVVNAKRFLVPSYYKRDKT